MTIGPGTVGVITGGGNGIGLALGHALAARGGRVAVADVNADCAREAAAEIGGEALGYHCDVTDFASLQRLAEAVVADFGGVDLVFANAGICISGTVIESDPREIEWLYDVNVIGAISTIRAFHSALEARAAETGTSRIIFTGSENSIGLPALGPASIYTSTKHALLGIADALRRDLADSKVEVSIFCPGITATRLWDGRATRHERYGGPVKLAEAQAAQIDGYLKTAGQDPALTARICLDGIDRGEFMIMTDPVIRQFADRRHAEVDAALDRLDERMGGYSLASAEG